MANGHQDIDWILQYCLERIQLDGARIDYLLVSYPEVADDLRPLLYSATWLMARKRALDPPREYLCNTWIWLLSKL